MLETNEARVAMVAEIERLAQSAHDLRLKDVEQLLSLAARMAADTVWDRHAAQASSAPRPQALS